MEGIPANYLFQTQIIAPIFLGNDYSGLQSCYESAEKNLAIILFVNVKFSTMAAPVHALLGSKTRNYVKPAMRMTFKVICCLKRDAGFAKLVDMRQDRMQKVIPKHYYFSTPMVNPDCPFGLKNPNVLVCLKHWWDKSKIIDGSTGLTVWMRKRGFGEQTPKFHITDSPELQIPQDVTNLLKATGMQHNPDLDAILIESFELWR